MNSYKTSNLCWSVYSVGTTWNIIFLLTGTLCMQWQTLEIHLFGGGLCGSTQFFINSWKSSEFFLSVSQWKSQILLSVKFSNLQLLFSLYLPLPKKKEKHGSAMQIFWEKKSYRSTICIISQTFPKLLKPKFCQYFMLTFFISIAIPVQLSCLQKLSFSEREWCGWNTLLVLMTFSHTSIYCSRVLFI